MAPKNTPIIYSISNVMDELMTTMSTTLDSETWTPRTLGTWGYPAEGVLPPSSLDDFIRLTREAGGEVDVFQRAKEVYRDMPSFPAADVSVDRNNGDLFFDVALPGYSEDDLEITFENDHMNISVGKDNTLNKDKKDKKESRVFIRNSLKSSRVELSVPVPSTRFRVKDTEASYLNGILSIRIPRQEEHAPHRITFGNKAAQIASE